tara:strand:- start:187 stop:885 length:699 start_codon:yes stop_codon:yes gene_type:complete
LTKIAITGHTSGIGEAIYDMCDLAGPKEDEVIGYSKSNGWNIAEEDGDKIIAELIAQDPDVLVNNAYYPKIQTKILTTLFEEWKAKPKTIVNIGSIAGYLPQVTKEKRLNTYGNDKFEQAQFIIRNSFRDGVECQIRMFNISFSFVNSPLLARSVGHALNLEKMIDVMDAAELIIDCIEDNSKPYHIVEQVVQCKVLTPEELVQNFMTGSRNMAKHVIRSDRAIKKANKSST